MDANKARIQRETRIARKVVRCLLDAGYAVAVHDGEEIAQEATTDRRKIYAALWSTDEDYLIAVRNGKRKGWVRLVYGNDCDLIADMTVNLDETVAAAQQLADALSSRH